MRRSTNNYINYPCVIHCLKITHRFWAHFGLNIIKLSKCPQIQQIQRAVVAPPALFNAGKWMKWTCDGAPPSEVMKKAAPRGQNRGSHSSSNG